MSKDDNGSSQTSDHKHRDIYMYAHTHTYTQQNSHFGDSNPLFLFRIYAVDISSIDEQREDEGDDDGEEKGSPALFITSLCN